MRCWRPLPPCLSAKRSRAARRIHRQQQEEAVAVLLGGKVWGWQVPPLPAALAMNSLAVLLLLLASHATGCLIMCSLRRNAKEAVSDLGQKAAKALQSGTKWFMKASKTLVTQVQQRLEHHGGSNAAAGQERPFSPGEPEPFHYDWATQLARISPGSRSAALGAMAEDDRLAVQDDGGSGGNANEPEERRMLRQRRIQEKHERMMRQLTEKRARDEAEAAEKSGKVELRASLQPKIDAWSAGKKDNIRALLASLHTVLWEDSGWTPPSMAEMVDNNKVKRTYMKANLVVHPDKVKQKGGSLEQVTAADMVFHVLKAAWSKFV
ncbi:hypothetical protein CHLNCDRAFT_59232 [Chlorella variabilis]|uniref:J domain-containing protein n=1 Tax=Chlorella variabilis TaxID=554065 RepID=E1ZRU7_CHLVA|nr:hypothetical protein CHLNCDRAFT_59232 [Chlorella variabilis]EFN51523.1 hypothetical protein CHLNCDRAFT_59232 [Chlorella variabilis]|eukprot:XP_005843625.1 hypothetical protein CHLNCDRAFT_59232 [Chlorella variabilis]